MRAKILLFLLLSLVLFLYLRMLRRRGLPHSESLGRLRAHLAPALAQALKKRGLKSGAPAFLRFFKESSELEIWIRDAIGGRYELFRTLPVMAHGNTPGPRVDREDGRTPEGCYLLESRHLSASEKKGLRIDTGYPNGLDKDEGRKGQRAAFHSGPMTEGDIALAPEHMEVLYLLTEQALRGAGRCLPLYILPFRMTDERMAAESASPWVSFWDSLRKGSDLFDMDRVPPIDGAKDGAYVFRKQPL